MSNRRKIERFAKQNNIKLLRCEFVKNREYFYGDSSDASSWQVDVEIAGTYECYDSFAGLGVNEDVVKMLDEIKYDLKEVQN